MGISCGPVGLQDASDNYALPNLRKKKRDYLPVGGEPKERELYQQEVWAQRKTSWSAGSCRLESLEGILPGTPPQTTSIGISECTAGTGTSQSIPRLLRCS